jgi:hypothetical protein
MAEVLRPGLHFRPGLANIPSERDQGVTEAVRIGIRQACLFERPLEDGPDRAGIAPLLAQLVRSALLLPQ